MTAETTETPTADDLDHARVFDGLRALQKHVYGTARAKGFHEDQVRLNQAREVIQGIEDEHVRGLLAQVIETARRDRVGNRLMLIVSEAAEGHEEIRKGRAPGEQYTSYPAVPPSFAVEFASGQDAEDAWRKEQDERGQGKPEGLASELADGVIRAFDLAEEEQIDLADVIRRKLRYNLTRPRQHGKKF